MKTRNYIGLASRLVVGLVFMISAITKWISLDAFDQFIYEHQLFSWVTTTVLTRLLLATEITLGWLLIWGVKPKLIKGLTIAFLVFFTLYILVKPYLFQVEEDNCHCFGEVFVMSDSQTLIKNIILLILTAFSLVWDKGVYSFKDSKVVFWLKNNQTYLTIVSFVAALIVGFALTMPDTLRYKLYGRAAKIDEKKFEYLISNEALADLHIKEGKKIVCMYSPLCKFCKRTAKRFDVMRKKYNIKDDNFALIFWGGDEAVERFFEKNEIKPLPYKNVPSSVFLQATKGRQPVVILMNNGRIEKLLKYPNIIDKDIIEFLNK
ncbi:MAG: hypothetical protein Q4Q06_02760 [Bacteroidota bacterium]|nr:hypothetical protein [Bacteroidota bacterium]